MYLNMNQLLTTFISIVATVIALSETFFSSAIYSTLDYYKSLFNYFILAGVFYI